MLLTRRMDELTLDDVVKLANRVTKVEQGYPLFALEYYVGVYEGIELTAEMGWCSYSINVLAPLGNNKHDVFSTWTLYLFGDKRVKLVYDILRDKYQELRDAPRKRAAAKALIHERKAMLE